MKKNNREIRGKSLEKVAGGQDFVVCDIKSDSNNNNNDYINNYNHNVDVIQVQSKEELDQILRNFPPN